MEYELPEGWKSENGTVNRNEVLYIQSAKGGWATVVFHTRWWNLGWGASRLTLGKDSNSSGREYKGRNWRKALIADAVNALQTVEAQ